jgi:DNA-binding winged helix-turn-helix (wHTH) protein
MFSSPMRVAFGDCVFDSETRELLRAGRAVPLPPKAFQLLELLIQSRPRALSQAELKDSLWPKSFVARSSLGRLVAELRSALGDEAAEPRYVRTLHGFGYAFCGKAAATDEATAGAASGEVWRLIWGAREIELSDGSNVLGRTPGCAVWIEAPGVSRRHACIVVTKGEATLEDLGSKNGTFLDGTRLRGTATLRDGDEIAVGTALLVLRAHRAGRSTETISRR